MAQNRYEYGTSPRKLEPEYNPYKNKKNAKKKSKQKQSPQEKMRQNVKVSKKEKSRRISQTLTVLALFVILLTISYRNSLINEKFSDVQDLKVELSAIKKENEQLEVNIENSLNLNNIEQIAKEKLGMQKLNNKQTVYVELPKKDYVKSTTEEVIKEEKVNWFDELIKKIFK